MADFLVDYSNLAGAGSAFQGFAQGFQNAQDSKMKRQEMQAKMDAMKDEHDRAATETALKLRLADTQKNPLTGALEDRPPSLKEKNAQIIGTAEKGMKPLEYDETGTVKPPQWDPNSPVMQTAAAKGVSAKNAGQRIQDMNDYRGKSLDLRNDVVDRREHQNVINKINANPNVKTRLQQYQNLDNTLSNIANADHITPEMFDEAQQSIRSNLGIKGASGVGERELTLMKSLGLNSERFKEFLTGSPADVGKDNKFLAHIKNLAALEKQNISGQFAKSLNAASSGHKSLYARRPDLQDDLKDAIGQQSAQLEDTSTPAQGLVGGGLVGKQGLVGAAPQSAAPAVDPVTAAKIQRLNELKAKAGQ